jgi:hypothetical protein
MTDDLIRVLASWQLVHEMADEGLKAAIERGRESGVEGMRGGPEAYVDGLASLVDAEKERIKASIAEGDSAAVPRTDDDAEVVLDEIRFELGELKGRMESMQTQLDAISRKLGGRGGGEGAAGG